MTEWTPVFFDQHLETLECSVVRVKHELCKSTQLRCTVPTIGAVDQYCILLNFNTLQDIMCALKDLGKNLSIPRAVKLCVPVSWKPSFAARNRLIGHIVELFKRITDNVDIVNVSKGDSTVRIVAVQTTVFIASSWEFICTCIEQWSSVKDINKASWIELTWIAKTNEPSELFVEFISTTEHSTAWLWTSPNRHTWYFIVIS